MVKVCELMDFDGYMKKAESGARIIVDDFSEYCLLDCGDKNEVESYFIVDQVTEEYLQLDLKTFYGILARILAKHADKLSIVEDIKLLFDYAGSPNERNYGLCDWVKDGLL